MTNGDQVVATRAECWMCSYCPVLASGKRGPTQEGMLTVQIGTLDLTLHTHPAGEPLATRPKPNRPLDHGFYAEMGDYVVQALRPAGDIDGGQNPAFDAAFLYPGQVLPPHLTRQRRQQGMPHHHQHYNDAAQEEEDEWDALLGWFGLGDSSEKKCDLPQPQRAGYPPIPTPVPNGVDVTPSYASEKPKPQPADPEPVLAPVVKREPPAPPPRADPFARLPPEYSGHKPEADITGKVSHLRAAVGERSTWSYDKKDGVEPWTVSTSNTTVPDQSPVSRSNVTTEEAKDTNTIDVAAKRRLEKLKALFGDDSEDEDELFTPTGTPKTSAQKPDADTFDDAQILAAHADEDKTLTVKMKDVPSQVVQAAVETPDKVLAVAAESIEADAKLIKDAGDEAQVSLFLQHLPYGQLETDVVFFYSGNSRLFGRNSRRWRRTRAPRGPGRWVI